MNAVNARGATLGTNLGSMFRKVGQIAKVVFAAVAIAAGAMFVVAIKKAADFELAMAKVKAISGATADEFEALSKKAKQLGLETAQTMTDIAAGMEALARAGFSAGEIVEAMAGVVALAESQTMDLGQAAEITANLLRQMGLETSETDRVVNLLAATASSSNTTVESLAESMKFFGPVARAMGMSIEEALAAVGKLGDAGLKGGIATRALQTSLLGLANPLDDAADLMKELGLAFFDANGEFVGLASAMSQIEVAFADLTQQQQLAAMSTLFGSGAVKQFSNLLGIGSEELAKYTAEITGTTVAFDQQAAMLDTLPGQWQILKGSFELLLVTIGEDMMPILKGLLQNHIIPLVNNITNWIEAQGGLLGVIDNTKRKITEWAEAHPVLMNAIGGTWSVLKGLLSFIVDVFTGDWQGAWQSIESVARGAAKVLEALWEGLKGAVRGLWEAMPIPDHIKTKIENGAKAVFGFVVDKAKQAWAGVMASVEENAPGIITAWGSLKEAAKNLWAAITDAFDGSGESTIAFRDIVKGAFDIVLTVVTTAIGAITDLFNIFAAALRGDWSQVWTEFKNFLGGIWDGIVKILDILGLKDAMIAGWNAIVSYFTETVPQLGRDIVQWMKDGLSGAWHAVIDWFRGAWDSIVNALTGWMPGFLKKWLGIGEDSGTKYAEGLEAARAEVAGAASGLVDEAVRAVEMKESELKQAGEDLGESLTQGMAGGVEQGGPLVFSALEGVNHDLEEQTMSFWETQSPSRKMFRMGLSLMAGLANGISAGSGDALLALADANVTLDAKADEIETQTFGGLVFGIESAFSDMVTTIFEGGGSVTGAMNTFLGDIVAAVKNSEIWGALSSLTEAFSLPLWAAIPFTIGLSSEVAEGVAAANEWLTRFFSTIGIGSQTYGPGTWRVDEEGNKIPIVSSARGNLFTAPALTRIAETSAEVALPLTDSVLSRLGAAIVGATPQPALASANGIQVDMRGLYDGATINVRDDQDISRIARETYDLWTSRMRGMGRDV